MRRGFTLLEMILAVSLFAMAALSAAVYFRLGLDVWKRVRAGPGFDRDAVLALERLGRDVRGTLRPAPAEKEAREKEPPYGGGATEMRLPALVASAHSGSGVQFGIVRYAWAVRTAALCREERSASDLYLERKKTCRPVLGRVRGLKFEYFLYNRIAKDYAWRDAWDARQGMPAAVRATIELARPGEKPLVLKKNFLLPVVGK